VSVAAQAWAMKQRCGNANRKLILWTLADSAHKDGRNAWVFVDQLADVAECDVRTVQRHTTALLDEGLIREGDQAIIPDKIPKRYRPIVYDLAMDDATVERWRRQRQTGIRAVASAAGAAGGRKAADIRRGVTDRHPSQDGPDEPRGDEMSPPRGGDLSPLADPPGVTTGVTTGVTPVSPSPKELPPPTEEAPTTSSPAAPPTQPAPSQDGLFDAPPPPPKSAGQRTNTLARSYCDRVPLSAYHSVAGVVRKAVDATAPDGSPAYTDDHIAAALDRLVDEDRPVTADTLRIALTAVRAPTSTALAARPRPGLPSPDEQLATGLELARSQRAARLAQSAQPPAPPGDVIPGDATWNPST
jgi:hypothetical protein